MISLRKCQFLVVLIVVLACVPALCQEPNQPKTELKFEISSEKQEWLTEESKKVVGELPIKPTHVGELFIWNLQRKGERARDHRSGRTMTKFRPSVDFSSHQVLRLILETSAGQSISEQQRELLRTGHAITTVGYFGDTVGNHFHFRCYAVSRDDTEKIVKALMEFLTNRNNEILQSVQNNKTLLEEKIIDCKDEISKKQDELKGIESKLDELGKTAHYLSPDEAEETVLELNKTLNALDVEVAGLQAKVSTIENYVEKYKSKKTVAGSQEALAKLEQMLSEQAVELASALARKEAATKIRNQAEEFYNLHKQHAQLPEELKNLRKNLSRFESDLRDIKEMLFKPNPDMLPTKVYQNKVTIYPVRVEE